LDEPTPTIGKIDRQHYFAALASTSFLELRALLLPPTIVSEDSGMNVTQFEDCMR